MDFPLSCSTTSESAPATLLVHHLTCYAPDFTSSRRATSHSVRSHPYSCESLLLHRASRAGSVPDACGPCSLPEKIKILNLMCHWLWSQLSRISLPRKDLPEESNGTVSKGQQVSITQSASMRTFVPWRRWSQIRPNQTFTGRHFIAVLPFQPTVSSYFPSKRLFKPTAVLTKFQIKILLSEPLLNRQFTIVEFPLTAYAAVTNGLEEDGPTDTKHVRILFSVVRSREDNELTKSRVQRVHASGVVL
ncbi:hypothetical protein T11_13792 [Trichinella zimbabwensis]|uniref:Uncharacterized protein n=1 Tax=Trichinella zimbabwensis TaxID=268475 RepID=A0A0V1HV68_9BILA|nr:hypothetical protein T11_13792 [Trichinella zimbabwensis]